MYVSLSIYIYIHIYIYIYIYTHTYNAHIIRYVGDSTCRASGWKRGGRKAA